MIKSLKLQNFRSYGNKTFNFDPTTNILVGPNAIGKTNILEAILVSRVGSSYRAKDIDLIAFKKDWARIDALDDGSERIIKIQKTSFPPKTFEINNQTYKRLPASLKLPVVLFEPNNMMVLNGSPEGRRTYLDNYTEQVDPEYGLILRKFIRAIAQRNSLLKGPLTPRADQLFPWNIRVSQLGGQIVKYRTELINKINKILPAIYSNLSKDNVQTRLVYVPQLPVSSYESSYLKKLEENLNEDIRIGFTTYGPHRDDFSFTFNGHPSNTYASRGEIKTAVLALKVTELENLKNTKEAPPIVLLDDVYSELDHVRRKALTSYLAGSQLFITTTDADLVSRRLALKSRVITL